MKNQINVLLLVALISVGVLFSTDLAYANYSTDSTDSSTVSVVNSITLSDAGDYIKWSVDGYSAKGFKVVWSKTPGATYPLRDGDKYNYHTDPYKYKDIVTAFDGAGKYYVRVCEYLGGKCGVYSNEITVSLGNSSDETADEDDDTTVSGSVKSITLSGSGSEIKWSVNGKSAQGFKIVWSKKSGATYPLRSGDKYHYYSESNKASDVLEAFDGTGTYYIRVCEYLGGRCGVYSNEIKLELSSAKDVACTMEYAPVCGKDNKTYSNKCVAGANGAQIAYAGECGKDSETTKIEDSATKLINSDVAGILAELKQLRDLVKEQASQISYLKKLTEGVKQIAQSAQDAINNFITYGVDENTKNLGAGERAAVMYSFKSAYDKLPETEEELADAIKIANGRWPSMTSEDAENKAKEIFEKIYKRIPDMEDAKDNAAVTVMAYGLRQKAENRNLESEKNGIKTFKNIFGHTPRTTEEWNIMQAITYSGATRGVDSDGDLLTDEKEAELGTDPKNADSDGDGYRDGSEVANGYDPLKND